MIDGSVHHVVEGNVAVGRKFTRARRGAGAAGTSPGGRRRRRRRRGGRAPPAETRGKTLRDRAAVAPRELTRIVDKLQIDVGIAGNLPAAVAWRVRLPVRRLTVDDVGF